MENNKGHRGTINNVFYSIIWMHCFVISLTLDVKEGPLENRWQSDLHATHSSMLLSDNKSYPNGQLKGALEASIYPEEQAASSPSFSHLNISESRAQPLNPTNINKVEYDRGFVTVGPPEEFLSHNLTEKDANSICIGNGSEFNQTHKNSPMNINSSDNLGQSTDLVTHANPSSDRVATLPMQETDSTTRSLLVTLGFSNTSFRNDIKNRNTFLHRIPDRRKFATSPLYKVITSRTESFITTNSNKFRENVTVEYTTPNYFKQINDKFAASVKSTASPEITEVYSKTVNSIAGGNEITHSNIGTTERKDSTAVDKQLNYVTNLNTYIMLDTYAPSEQQSTQKFTKYFSVIVGLGETTPDAISEKTRLTSEANWAGKGHPTPKTTEATDIADITHVTGGTEQTRLNEFNVTSQTITNVNEVNVTSQIITVSGVTATRNTIVENVTSETATDSNDIISLSSTHIEDPPYLSTNKINASESTFSVDFSSTENVFDYDNTSQSSETVTMDTEFYPRESTLTSEISNKNIGLNGETVMNSAITTPSIINIDTSLGTRNSVPLDIKPEIEDSPIATTHLPEESSFLDVMSRQQKHDYRFATKVSSSVNQNNEISENRKTSAPQTSLDYTQAITKMPFGSRTESQTGRDSHVANTTQNANPTPKWTPLTDASKTQDRHSTDKSKFYPGNYSFLGNKTYMNTTVLNGPSSSTTTTPQPTTKAVLNREFVKERVRLSGKFYVYGTNNMSVASIMIPVLLGIFLAGGAVTLAYMKGDRTIRECLEDMEERYPELYGKTFGRLGISVTQTASEKEAKQKLELLYSSESSSDDDD